MWNVSVMMGLNGRAVVACQGVIARECSVTILLLQSCAIVNVVQLSRAVAVEVW